MRGQLRQRLMVFTVMDFLGFLTVAGPVLAVNYVTTKISELAYDKGAAHLPSTSRIYLYDGAARISSSAQMFETEALKKGLKTMVGQKRE